MEAHNQTFHPEDSNTQSDEDSDYYPSQDESVNSDPLESEDDTTFDFNICPDMRKVTPMYGNTKSTNTEMKLSNGKASKVRFGSEDTRFWSSLSDKQRWVARYHAANQAWIKTYGCCIDSLAHPQITKQYQKERNFQFYYRLILLVIMCYYVSQVYKRYNWISNSPQVQPLESPEITKSNSPDPLSTDELAHRMAISCSDSILQLAKAKNEPSIRQSAIEACNDAVEHQLRGGSQIMLIEALVLRGDLWSLLAEFDSAERDYWEAQKTAKDLMQWSIPHVLESKIFANQILHLMLRKEYALLLEKCDNVSKTSSVQEIREIAHIWMQALKKETPLANALKKCRIWTLLRANVKRVSAHSEI